MSESEVKRQFCQYLSQVLPQSPPNQSEIKRPEREEPGGDLGDWIALLPASSKLMVDEQQTPHSVHPPNPMLMVVLEGQVRLTTAEQSATFGAGDLLFFTQGQSFEMTRGPADRATYRSLMLQFPEALLERFRRTYPESSPVTAAAPPPHRWSNDAQVVLFPLLAHGLMDFIRALLRQDFQADRLGEQLYEHHLLKMLLLLRHSNVEPLLQQTVYPDFSTQVRLLIRAKLASHCSLEQVAQALDMSVSTLKRRLQAAQLNYRQLLDEERMGKAMELLGERQQTIAEIALACGYRSPSRFATRFRAYYNMGPSEARAQQQSRTERSGSPEQKIELPRPFSEEP